MVFRCREEKTISIIYTVTRLSKKNLFSSKFNFFEFPRDSKDSRSGVKIIRRDDFPWNTFDNLDLSPLYVTYAHTADHNSFTRDVEKGGKRIHCVLAFEENLPFPRLLPRRPFSESRGGRRGGDRNEETLDANGERSNVAGKISSGEILAAGCFCIETWPSFFFSFYLLLSPAPPSSLPFDENSTARQNRH